MPFTGRKPKADTANIKPAVSKAWNSPELNARIAAVWPDILADVTEGGIVNAICKSYGFSRGAVAHYRRADPERIRQWRDARVESAGNLEEMAITAASNAKIDPLRARVLVDTLKWAAGKRNPDTYGERTRVDIRATVDIGSVLSRAEARLTRLRTQALDMQQVEEAVVNRIAVPVPLVTIAE